jgi:hypothetical protein
METVTMNDRRYATAFSGTPAAAAPPAPPQRKPDPANDWVTVFGEFDPAERLELDGVIRKHGKTKLQAWMKAWFLSSDEWTALSETMGFDPGLMPYIRNEVASIDGVGFPGTR